MNSVQESRGLGQSQQDLWRQELEEHSMTLCSSVAAYAANESMSASLQAVNQIEKSLDSLMQCARSHECKGIEYVLSLLLRPTNQALNAEQVGKWVTWSEMLLLFVAGGLRGENIHDLLDKAPLQQALPDSFREMVLGRLRIDLQAVNTAIEGLNSPIVQVQASLQAARDELTMLAEACAGLGEDVCPQIITLPLPEPGDDAQNQSWSSVLEAMSERFIQFAHAAEFLELEPLQSTMQALAANLNSLREQLPKLSEELRGALMALPDSWGEYFRQPSAETAALAFSALHSDDWPLGFDGKELAEAECSLGGLVLIQSRQVQARDSEVSDDELTLDIPPEADRSVVDSLLAELPQLSSEFSSLIGQLSQGNTEVLEPAQRIAHTLKGSANTVGIRGIANLTHQLEDILQLLGAAQTAPTGDLAQTLDMAADCLAEMAEAVAGLGAPPQNARQVYEATIAWTNRLLAGEPFEQAQHHVSNPPGTLSKPPAVTSTSASTAQVTAPATGLSTEGKSDTRIAPVAEAESMLRVPLSLVDRLLELAGESALMLSRIQNESSVLGDLHRTMRDGSDRLSELANELERLVDVRAAAMQGTRRTQSSATNSSSLLDDGDGPQFDALEMEQYNELHTVARRIAEAGADTKLLEQQIHASVGEVSNTISALEGVQMQLRDAAMQTRMVAVSTVSARLSRAVRQTARMVGKDVQLSISGENTHLDNELLQGLLEPLMHLLRNAVDHGIEFEQQRVAAGKPASGTVSLTFERSGAQLKVYCADDGAGLNLAKIRERGIERGIINGLTNYTDEQLTRLILTPGFTTRDETSQVSGRGIGMDVVHQAIRQLRGQIDIETIPGEGCRFVISLPLRLSSIPVIVARSNTHTIGLALRGIEQIVSGESLTPDESRYLHGEILLPAHRLETLLGLPATYFKKVGATQIVLLVRDDLGELCAIITPELAQTQNVVLKPLSPYLGLIPGVEGAAVLGDGSVASVCDIPELLTQMRNPQRQGSLNDSFTPFVVSQTNDPICLIVDDSVSVRRTMELFAKDLGFAVESASDGLDALGKLQNIVPAVMLVDLEMPRMNGVELTAAIRQDVRLSKVPVIMITSRYTEKHRDLAQQAGVNTFMTKPYTEDELASNIHKLVQI